MNLWELFFQHFKIKDDLVLIDDDDQMHVGKLVDLKLEGCALQLFGSNAKPKFFNWKDIRFISHDGFPVERLQGADGSKLIEQLDGKPIHELIHKALKSPKREKPKQIVFGDPYLIENVDCRLINGKNCGPEWRDGLFEECICMRAPDGACAELYDFRTIYHFAG